jgi:hypothetical protein
MAWLIWREFTWNEFDLTALAIALKREVRSVSTDELFCSFEAIVDNCSVSGDPERLAVVDVERWLQSPVCWVRLGVDGVAILSEKPLSVTFTVQFLPIKPYARFYTATAYPIALRWPTPPFETWRDPSS